jgi:hypothetical protein
VGSIGFCCVADGVLLLGFIATPPSPPLRLDPQPVYRIVGVIYSSSYRTFRADLLSRSVQQKRTRWTKHSASFTGVCVRAIWQMAQRSFVADGTS